jgi:hypothetical protein
MSRVLMDLKRIGLLPGSAHIVRDILLFFQTAGHTMTLLGSRIVLVLYIIANEIYRMCSRSIRSAPFEDHFEVLPPVEARCALCAAGSS